MTLVFDSGVLISAFHFGGTPLAALRAASIHGSIAHCVEMDGEVRKALTGKFNWSRSNVERALRGFTHDATLIEIPGTLRGICRDPKDDMVLECALLAKADFIVSGDKDLLSLKAYSGISILMARACLDLFGDPKQ